MRVVNPVRWFHLLWRSPAGTYGRLMGRHGSRRTRFWFAGVWLALWTVVGATILAFTPTCLGGVFATCDRFYAQNPQPAIDALCFVVGLVGAAFIIAPIRPHEERSAAVIVAIVAVAVVAAYLAGWTRTVVGFSPFDGPWSVVQPADPFKAVAAIIIGGAVGALAWAHVIGPGAQRILAYDRWDFARVKQSSTVPACRGSSPGWRCRVRVRSSGTLIMQR